MWTILGTWDHTLKIHECTLYYPTGCFQINLLHLFLCLVSIAWLQSRCGYLSHLGNMHPRVSTWLQTTKKSRHFTFTESTSRQGLWITNPGSFFFFYSPFFLSFFLREQVSFITEPMTRHINIRLPVQKDDSLWPTVTISVFWLFSQSYPNNHLTKLARWFRLFLFFLRKINIQIRLPVLHLWCVLQCPKEKYFAAFFGNFWTDLSISQPPGKSLHTQKPTVVWRLKSFKKKFWFGC